VTIDPTFIVGDVQDCYINAGSPTTSFCNQGTLNAGFDGSNASRALLKFDLSAIPATNTVVSAKLLLYLGSASTSNATTLSLYQLTHSWTTGATWNTYDGTNIWTTPGGDFSGTAAATTSGIAATGVWYSWSPSSLVQDWVNGSTANNGLIVKEPTENVSNVLSFNTASGTYPPYLQVVHQQGGNPPGSYSSAVLADSPVAYWHLDETTGSTMVDAQGADSGTYQGGFTLAQTALTQPASGTSVSLNGSTGYGTASTLTALQGDNTRSIELWFQTSSATAQHLFDAGAAAGSSNQMFSLIVVPQGWVTNNPPNGVSTPGLYVALWSQDLYVPGLNLEDGKRHHVVLELTGNNVWLYVDGATPGAYFTSTGGNDNFGGSWGPNRYLQQQPITLTTTPNTAANPILIGTGRYVSTGLLNGKLDEVAVYSTALSATQVQNHWQAGNGLPWSPTNVMATAGTNQVTVSWTAPTFNGSGITGYVVTPQVGSNLRTPITFNSTSTSQIISNLSGGTGYTFTVSAFNTYGLGVPSNASSAATPSGAALPLYEDTVLADSPVGFWPLGEASFNTATDLTQTLHGQYFGSYTQGDTGPFINYPNKATSFSGSNAYVRLNHTALLEPAAVTVEVWIKPTSVPTNDTPILVSPQSGNAEWSTNGYVMTLGGTNGVNPDKITWAGIATPTTIPTGVWSYVVATTDTTATRIYINGKQSVAVAGGGPNYGGSPNFDAQVTRYTFPGDMSDLAIYSSSLTAAQVSAHYAAAGYAPGPVSNLVATASTNSASLTWTQPSYSGTSSITSYTVTPIVDGKAGTAIAISGNGTGANIPNLPGSASYSFVVQANSAGGSGVAVTSAAVAVGAPSAGPGGFGTYLLMLGGPGQGQPFAHYGFVSRSNTPGLATWTIEERLWGFNTLSNTGGRAALGLLSGTTASPTDRNPIAGFDFHTDFAPLQTTFVWPGGSCVLPHDVQGLPLAFDSSVNTPVHLALTYDGTTVRAFINGTLALDINGQPCTQITGSAALPPAPFGYMDNSGLSQAYFDEIRLSSVARWTANFNVPTGQYVPPYDNTVLIWHLNDYAISKLPVTDIYPGRQSDAVNYDGGLVPSAYRDFSGNANHANIVWSTGAGAAPPPTPDDFRRPYSLGQGITVDELAGGVSPWLCPCTANAGDPVDLATGQFWQSYADFAIPGRVPLAFTRTYSSLRVSNPLQPTKFGSIGYGWTYNYNEYLSFSGPNGTGTATVHAVNGSAVVFTFDTQQSKWVPPPSEHVTLTKNGDNTFTLMNKTRDQTVFNVAVNDPGGNTSTGTLSKFVDRHGYQTVLTTNLDGTIQKVTDPAGRILTFGYTTIGSKTFVANITDGAARQVIFTYGTNSGDATTYQSLIQVQDVGLGLRHFTYDTNHYLQTITDPRGGQTTNVYDPNSHHVISQTDAMQRQTTLSYSGAVTTVTDPSQHQMQFEFINNILMSRTMGTSPNTVATTYAYDPLALGQTAVVGSLGEAATATRDANDNALSSTDPMGRVSTRTFNTFSEPLTDLDPSQVATTTTYNGTGDVATISRPLLGTQQVQTTTYTYTDAQHVGDVTSITDGDNKVWLVGHDIYGNRTSLTDPLGDRTTYAFDSVGRMTSMVTAKGNVSGGKPANFTWTYTFDAFGNRLTATDPLTHRVTYHYDADQNLDQMTDADGNVATFVYDADNELTQKKRADSPQTMLTTDYNPDGTVLNQKDGKGNPILTFGYNTFAQRTTVTDALGNTTTYTFDNVGNITSKQDPGGNCSATPPAACTMYAYDAANQLTSVTFSDGTTPNISGIKYDPSGQRIAATDGTGTSAWAWDSLNRLVSYTNGNGAQVQWVYNLRNLPTTVTYPTTLSVTEGYDNAGRWTSAQDWNGNLTTFGYDANSNLTTETFPTASGVIDTFTFNNADHITAITSKKGRTTLFSATYTRDAANQLTSDTSGASGTGSYKYDPLNQLCYAGSSNTSPCSSPPSGTAYKYDAADNLIQNGTTQQQAFNNSDELCWTAATTNPCATPPSGASTYQYDLRGNRIAFNPNGAQAQTFAYDQANRLSSFTVGAATTSYGYNADSLRMCKLAGSAPLPCTSPSASQFVWDSVDGNLILKDGATLYVYGPGGLPVEQVTASATYYFHHDQGGSTRLVTTSAGANQATYTFDPFGKLVASTGSLVNPLLYTGQYLDSETGSYYLRARYYDPRTAQFLSRDPATESTREPYGYVSNSPLNRADPTGLFELPNGCQVDWQPPAYVPGRGLQGGGLSIKCPGQDPGGGQVPEPVRPTPSPSPTPPDEPDPCGCVAYLEQLRIPGTNIIADDWLNLTAVANSPIFEAAYTMYAAPFGWLGVIGALPFEGAMAVVGNSARAYINTRRLGTGTFEARAGVSVVRMNGEACPYAWARAAWHQTVS
jgi:RHS repeat-associated protein